MMLRNNVPSVTWAQFELCNSDPQTAFENMCRILFNNFFFGGKAILHSDHNNPGIEVLPQKNEESGLRISFQAKYFTSLDYQQIRHSAEMAIKYYKGDLDVIYLYCNKDVTTTSQAYRGIIDLLEKNGIALIPITNQTILDQALLNDTIAWYYFDSHNLSNEWFSQNLKDSLSALGPRYNSGFNVTTHSDEYINLFMHSASSAVQINQRKTNILSNLRGSCWKYSKCEGIIKRICNAIESLADITPESIQDCLTWNNVLSEKCESEFSKIQEIIAEKEKASDIAREMKDFEKVGRLRADIQDLKELLKVPEKVSLIARERLILQKKVLIVLGDAGSGKSQLFANAANNAFMLGIPTILLLGHTFLTKDSISIQIPTQLQLDLSIDAILQKLECIGQQLKTPICIFVDAINESGYKQIWMTGLSRLINQISDLEYVRLAISVRSGYEKLVFDNSLQEKIKNSEIASMVHTGFQEESVRATREFLNYYGIPFLPSYFLQTEMTNPLFLKLFCENYDGEEVDLFTLFDKVIRKSDEEAQQAAGLEYSTNLLKYLLNQIAEIRLEKGSLSITKEALFNLPFWNTYGLQEKKVPFVVSLERSGMLIATVYEDEEIYYIGYNLLEDFLCAKQLINRKLSKDELVNYLKKDLLGVTNGAISKYENQDIFIVACGLYAEKYGEECINPIVDCIEDEHDFDDLVRSFIMSFRWRKSKSIDGSSFMDMARNLRADPEILFRVLIECSTKKGHPLNADMLHSVLLPMRLSQRDYVWTIYINGLSYDEERVFQLIDQFDHGDMLDGLSEDNTQLLLILFTWLLTSSNRHLRDIASKGSIELLKNKFSLCLPLLQKFETVNDPYVIQRLFGVIFGACMKRVNKERGHFRELVDHIYQTIFNQDNVYPDVMLRDYARLIIERWIYEYPDDCEFIDQTMIVPPYRSTAIPTVEKQTYYQQGEKHRGFNAIDNSMTINHKECPGMYGDFGRYTFQAALESFKDVDVVEMYHYAMQYIRDELGYDEELFGNYDTYFLGRSYNRHANRKVERIGKKYQWIALYNVLARVSDVYQLSRWDEEPRRFEGPWNPYIRDFDPTLNRHFLRSDILPGFNYPQLSEELFLEIEPLPNKRTISEWNHGDTMFYSSLNSKLMFNDKEGNTWIALKLYECVKNKHHDIDGHSIGFTKGSQEIWHMEHGLFMRKGEFEENKQYLKKINFTGRHFPEGSDVYQLFNREYAWSSGMEDVFGTYWFDHEIEVGEKRKEKQIRKMPDFVYHENGDITIAYKDVECEIDVPEEIVTLHVLPAYSRVLWEAEYDASQEETTSFDIPCKQIINCLKLEQRKFDGYFYSADGDLVCFDSNLCGPCDGLIIRKDYLDRFLEKNDLALFWTSIGEKQFFLGDHAQSWGEWSGFFQYDGKQVIGCLECMNPQMK